MATEQLDGFIPRTLLTIYSVFDLFIRQFDYFHLSQN